MAVQCRSDDSRTLALLAPLSHLPTLVETEAERAVMRTLEGGCSVPIGVACRWSDPCPSSSSPLPHATLTLHAIVCSPDGTHLVQHVASANMLDFGNPAIAARMLGECVAHALLDKGAGLILAQVRPKGIGGEVTQASVAE